VSSEHPVDRLRVRRHQDLVPAPPGTSDVPRPHDVEPLPRPTRGAADLPERFWR